MKRKPNTKTDLSNSGPMASLRLSAIEYIDPSTLRRYEGKLRKLPEKQIAKLTSSIGVYGFINPIIADEDGGIIAGEARHEAALRMNLPQVPVIRIDHLTPAERRAFRIADNKLSQEGKWDLQALAFEVDALITLDDVPIELTGFDSAEIDVMIYGSSDNNADCHDPADERPNLPSKPKSVLGDIWILGDHKLLCGSSLDASSWATLLGDEIAIHAFVDPPYNVKIANNVSGLGKVKHGEFAMASGEMSRDQFTLFNADWLNAMLPHCADGAIIDICMDWRHVGELEEAIRACGLELLNICVWCKTNAGNGAMYRSQHEFVFISKKGSAPHVNNIQLGKYGRYRTNCWTYAGANTFSATRADDLAAHPTVKPVALVADAIRDVSNKGQIVLDAFMGSGTTILAAERTGRLARGIEIEPQFVDVAIARWEKLTGRKAVLAETGETFAEVSQRRLADGNVVNASGIPSAIA
jgi:DNA modification methylase